MFFGPGMQSPPQPKKKERKVSLVFRHADSEKKVSWFVSFSIQGYTDLKILNQK
jgi:hypothetical protein